MEGTYHLSFTLPTVEFSDAPQDAYYSKAV